MAMGKDVDFIEILIYMVSQRPYLHERSSNTFRNTTKKRESWEEISKTMIAMTGSKKYTGTYVTN